VTLMLAPSTLEAIPAPRELIMPAAVAPRKDDESRPAPNDEDPRA
jgi:hypothetical protein